MSKTTKKKETKIPSFSTQPSLVNTINFQIVAINVLMLIAFVLVMNLVIGAMKNSNNNSKASSDYVLGLSTSEAELKSDVMSLYDQVTGYVMADAVETKDALAPVIEAAEGEVEQDIADLQTAFADSGTEDTKQAITDIQGEYERLVKLLDESMALSDS